MNLKVQLPITGKLVTVAGLPGTGKTMFAATFALEGLNQSESVVWVSFSETRDTFLDNMANAGCSFEPHISAGKFTFLDLPTPKENEIRSALDDIVRSVTENKASRLVIDSFSAIAQNFVGERVFEARIMLDTLGKIVSTAGCTTLLVVEDEDALRRMEGYVADGVLIFRRHELVDRLLRELEIAKLRGVEVKQHKHVFSLTKDFRLFASLTPDPLVAEKPEPFKGTPHTDKHYSSGVVDFDRILGGGFNRGSHILFQISAGVPLLGEISITGSIALNYIWNGGGVVTYPRSGFGPEQLERVYLPSLKPGVKLADVYRMITSEKAYWNKPYVVPLENVSADGIASARAKAEQELKSLTGVWPLTFVGRDSYEAEISKSDLSIEHHQANEEVKRMEAKGTLGVWLARAGQKSLEVISGLARYHFLCLEKDGCLLLYGIRPRTEIYAVEPNFKNWSETKLTPIR